MLLVYKLPFKINLNKTEVKSTGILNKIKATFIAPFNQDSYSLLVQKQSGSQNDKFVGQVQYPVERQINVSYPSAVNSAAGVSTYEAKLQQDLFYFIGLKN